MLYQGPIARETFHSKYEIFSAPEYQFYTTFRGGGGEGGNPHDKDKIVSWPSYLLNSDNGLSPGRRQAIIWTNAGMLLIGPLGTNFSEILIEI